MPAVHAYKDFYAIHDHMRGPRDGPLRVGGTVVFRHGGWSARLRPHEPKDKEPIPFNPKILYLDLVLTPPNGSGTSAITDVELEECGVAVAGYDYDEVHFILVGGQDDVPPDPLDVEHPTRAQGAP